MKEVIDTVSVALASGEVEELGGAVMQEVNRSLLSAGVNEEWADKIDNLIVLLFIIGIALLANVICRRIILRVVAKLVKQTKATWDDIVFDHKVMVHLSRMVAPILIYIAIPIAFPEHADSGLLDFLRRQSYRHGRAFRSAHHYALYKSLTANGGFMIFLSFFVQNYSPFYC